MAQSEKRATQRSPFKTDTTPEDFAAGIPGLAKINDLMRSAQLADGAALQRVRAKSADREVIRAKALSDTEAIARAEIRSKSALQMAAALDSERLRVQSEEELLGDVTPAKGTMRILGKVLEAGAKPAAAVDVLLRGEECGALFRTETGERGEFAFDVRVGGDKRSVAEGEPLHYEVRRGKQVLLRSGRNPVIAREGQTRRLRLALLRPQQRRPEPFAEPEAAVEQQGPKPEVKPAVEPKLTGWQSGDEKS
jgi:hypothetical protein